MNTHAKQYCKLLKYFPVIAILLTGTVSTQAQVEPMFTQYIFNETFINPAYAGSHEGLAINMLYRDQWAGLKGSPKTQTFSMHMPVKKKKIGIGLSVLNETIGISKMFLVSGDFAYRIRMPSSALAFGLKGGFVNHVENYSDVNTIVDGDRQFTNDVRKYFLPNAGFGIYYTIKREFYASFSIPRLLQNKIDPSKQNGVVQNIGTLKIWHYYIATGYVFDVNENTKFKPSIMFKFVQNAPVELDVSLNFILGDMIWLGTAYRTGDAVSGLFGFQLSKLLRMCYSYDYTLTNLQKYSSGSHEFTISYDIGIYKTRITSLRYF